MRIKEAADMRNTNSVQLIYFCALCCFASATTYCGNDASEKAAIADSSPLPSDSGVLPVNDRDIPSLDSEGIKMEDAPQMIEGDWFPCLDKDCKELGFRGERYTAFGDLVELFAPSKNHKGKDYCFIKRVNFRGSYKWNGKVLTRIIKNFEGPIIVYSVAIDDSILNRIEKGKSATERFKRVKGINIKPCAEKLQYICPRNFIEITSSEKCILTLGCDDEHFSIRFNSVGRENEGQSITCESIKKPAKQVTLDEPLCPSNKKVPEVLSILKEKCGWDIWVPELFATEN
jgi:hypothetical protein